MKISLIIGTAVLIILGGLGIWYWQTAKQPAEVSFENAPLASPVIEETVAEKREEEPKEEVKTNEPVPPEAKPASLTTPPPESESETQQVTSPESTIKVTNRLLRFGHRIPTSPRSVDTVIIHSSYNALGGDVYSVDKTISEYEQYGVGAHYLIDRSGTILRLVEEKNIAHHAGTSKMPDGRRNVNDFSIGIELIGTEDSGFTEKQYEALNDLLDDIRNRHTIKHVVGHGDIAPGRKTDPWKFDWKRLD